MRNQNDCLIALEIWQEVGGVMIIGCNVFHSLAPGKSIKKQEIRNSFEKALLDPGVCDEGHILKNEKTGISHVVNRIETQRRICLTDHFPGFCNRQLVHQIPYSPAFAIGSLYLISFEFLALLQ